MEPFQGPEVTDAVEHITVRQPLWWRALVGLFRYLSGWK
jgi:hypothetical protein